jgi:RHS repeat-associated protein
MRDAETGLDFFGARFYSGALGRFTSADDVFADQDPSDPMSWNLMAYVRNNPLRYTDPTGRGCVAQSNPQAGDAAKAGAILWSNSALVPGPSCGEIDKADQELKPTVKVTEEIGSVWAFLTAPEVPRYVPNDRALPDSARNFFSAVYYRTAHDLECAGLGFAVGDHPYRAGWLEAQKHMPSKEHLRAVQQSLMRCVGLGSEM